jgi:hypothetical protein
LEVLDKNHPNIVGDFHREQLKLTLRSLPTTNPTQAQNITLDLHLRMEYRGSRDLGRVIKDFRNKGQFAEENFVWSIVSQLVTALYRCHYGVDALEEVASGRSSLNVLGES